MINIKKLLKYLTFGLLIGSAIMFIPSKRIYTREILMIAMLASISFAVMDMYCPSVTIVTKPVSPEDN